MAYLSEKSQVIKVRLRLNRFQVLLHESEQFFDVIHLNVFTATGATLLDISTALMSNVLLLIKRLFDKVT